MTLFAISAFRLGKGNLQMVGNMQQRQQTFSAAQSAIDKMTSSITFTTTPNVSSTAYVSVNGSGTNDIKVITTPTCVSFKPIPNSALSVTNVDDANCLVSVNQQAGVAGAFLGGSLCANAMWNIQANAIDVGIGSNVQYTVNQGEAIRMAVTATCP